MEKNIKPYLEKMVKEGHTEAKFGKIENAHHFKNILAKHNVPSRIEEKLGHATTVDTEPGTILTKHFHVFGLRTTAHNVLGKFV
jgi:hypothetical protein